MNALTRGIVAHPGLVKGVARIIDEHDLSAHFNEGDILIVSFTSPLFVPHMSKAAAIVTDLGGKLCHAAIVAREIGTPCIVGTQNATKVIQPGQMIVVDATKGIVYAP